MPTVIASHGFFGSVTSEDWSLIFHPAGTRSDIIYSAIFGREPSVEDFRALVDVLPAFEVFCRELEVRDATVRRHFGTWPGSAGEFELVGAIMAGEGKLPWSTTALSADCQRFALQYRALDEVAWEFAGIPFFPPIFTALFDEKCEFRGIDHNVEQGLSRLPAIMPKRRRGSYAHPYFGRSRFDELSRLTTLELAGRKVPFDLFMTTAHLAAFEPKQLDGFVSLAEGLEALDAKVRLQFPTEQRLRWLEERFEYGNPALRRALDKVFPDATGATEISAEAFSAALVLKRGCFSLSPDESGGGALALDYAILPARVDNELFVARFSLQGDLLDTSIES
jgi:hypothetical protein